jgi:hypothetical protein
MDHFESLVHVPHIGIESQLELIRDTVRGRSDWLMRLSNLRQLENTITELRSWPKNKFDRFPRVEKDRVYPLPQARSNGFFPWEGDYAWINGNSAVFQFDIDTNAEDAESWLVLVLAGRKSKRDVTQRCTISVNGKEIASELISERLQRQFFKMPQDFEASPMRVELKLAHADPVVDREGKTVDPRYLGLRVQGFGVMTKRPALQLKKDHIYDFNRDSEELAPAINGFFGFEGMGAWIDGTSASIEMKLEPDNRKSWLTLFVAGRKSAQTGGNQVCAISIDNTLIGSITIGEHLEEHDLELPTVVGQTRLTFSLAHAEQVIDELGATVDPRNLGLCVKGFGIMTTPRAIRSPKNNVDGKDVSGTEAFLASLMSRVTTRLLNWNGTRGRP